MLAAFMGDIVAYVRLFHSAVFGGRAGRPWPAACALAACASQVGNRIGVNAVMGELTLWQPRMSSSVIPQPSDTLVRMLVGPIWTDTSEFSTSLGRSGDSSHPVEGFE